MKSLSDNLSGNIKDKKENRRLFLLSVLLIFIVYTVYLTLSGYFNIGLMSDDYLNFISAEVSGFKEKFTSDIPYYSKYHFRPLWFLSIEFSIYLNGLLNNAYDNFIFYRADNLLLFFLIFYLVADFTFRLTLNYRYSLIILIICLIYPHNNINILWTTGKVDILCAIFIFSSLIFTVNYLKEKKFTDLVFTLLFFIFGLITKETAVILPFITFVMLKINDDKIKMPSLKTILIPEIIILIFYVLFRFTVTDFKFAGILNQYQSTGIAETAGITLRAIISLLIPHDFLTLRNGIIELDIYIYLYLIFLSAALYYFIINLIKSKSSKYLFYLFLLFMFSIFPNLIAGYFRPQLILIPFLLTCIALVLISIKLNFIKSFLKNSAVILLVFCCVQNYHNIRDWEYSYGILKSKINMLINTELRDNRFNFIIGLPSRFNSAYISDYSEGPYFYFSQKIFEPGEKNITDIVHIGALDTASLNSELKYNFLPDKEIEIETTGATQYLLKLDHMGSEFKDDRTEIHFSKFNEFGKPIKANIKILSDSADTYIFNENQFQKIAD